MGAQEPLVMDLGDPGAGPETAGGKGSSLARVTRAGFRVPPGFHVTTSAYLDFIGRDGLREQLLSAASDRSGDGVAFWVARPRGVTHPPVVMIWAGIDS